MQYAYTICGSGLTGLILANYLIKYKNVSPMYIIILEASEHSGGLYNPWLSRKFGALDKGMHIYYETGIKEIDDLVYKCLEAHEWIILEGNRKDVSGAYFNSKLQHHTPYPDLREVSFSKRSTYIGDIFQQLEEEEKYKTTKMNTTCEQYWKQRFGESLTRDVLNNITKKLYGHPASELDSSAAYTTKLDRVCLFDAQVMRKFDDYAGVRQVLAYPDQLNMPNYRTNNQRGLYPKKGMKHLTSQLSRQLEAQGVKILYNTKIELIGLTSSENDSSKDFIEASCSTYSNNKTERFSITAQNLIWPGKLSSLSKIINSNDMKYQATVRQDKNIKGRGSSIFIYFKVKPEEHNLEDLYYAYFYDLDAMPFRITNLNSYCKIDKELDTLCVEYHFTEEQTQKLTISPTQRTNDFFQKALAELKEMNILTPNSAPISDGFALPTRVFPVPLLQEATNYYIANSLLAKIFYPSKNTKETIFFLSDTLLSFHEQLNEQ